MTPFPPQDYGDLGDRCAICEEAKGTEYDEDGRLVCPRCRKTREREQREKQRRR